MLSTEPSARRCSQTNYIQIAPCIPTGARTIRHSRFRPGTPLTTTATRRPRAPSTPVLTPVNHPSAGPRIPTLLTGPYRAISLTFVVGVKVHLR